VTKRPAIYTRVKVKWTRTPHRAVVSHIPRMQHSQHPLAEPFDRRRLLAGAIGDGLAIGERYFEISAHPTRESLPRRSRKGIGYGCLDGGQGQRPLWDRRTFEERGVRSLGERHELQAPDPTVLRRGDRSSDPPQRAEAEHPTSRQGDDDEAEERNDGLPHPGIDHPQRQRPTCRYGRRLPRGFGRDRCCEPPAPISASLLRLRETGVPE
jgi:hypothetical protein